MNILTIATLGSSGGLLIGGSDQQVAVSETRTTQREAADEVFQFLTENCPECFVDALARRLIAYRAERDSSFAIALGADPNTRYLLEPRTQ